MSMNDTTLLVEECLTGARGEMSREEIIADVSSSLVDHVFEVLLEDGIRFEDQRIYRAIEGLIARGMIRQAEKGFEMMNAVLKAA